MPLILNIDTATETASVCLSDNGEPLAYSGHNEQREHASYIHNSVAGILKKANKTLDDVTAFAVTSGPGSYTGLRVGMATAKGFCYSLSRPLILISTLEAMALAALKEVGETVGKALFYPMIDARRMEVFTATYDENLREIAPPQAIVLDESSLNDYFAASQAFYFGSGSHKLRNMVPEGRGNFLNVKYTAVHVGMLAEQAFQQKRFAELTYSEPTYVKEFYSTAKADVRK